jgi:hypothetical protein
MCSFGHRILTQNISKGKDHSRRGHEGSEREKRYSSILSLTSAFGVGGKRHASATSLPGKKPVTHCTGGLLGPRPVWMGAENLAPTGI